MAGERITKVNVNGQVYDLAGSGTGEVIHTTYAELVSLIGSSGLVVGAKYRITDYITSFKSWRSGGHQFDVIVTACANNALYTEAQAALHDGDGYFANSDLNSWKLWYDVTNNTAKHKQATSEGKGTILRMIDEFDNDADYDFKNAMFEVTNTNYASLPSSLYFYTFSFYEKSVKQLTQEDISDMSINSTCKVRNNKIKGLSLATCKICCIGGKKGILAALNPKIENNSISLESGRIYDGICVLSDGVNNLIINNEIIGDFIANNPIVLKNSKIVDLRQFKFPYTTNSFYLDDTEIIARGELNIEIKEFGPTTGGIFENMTFKKSGTVNLNLIIEYINKYRNTNFLMEITSTSARDVTISERDLVNDIVLVEEDSPYKVIDLSSLNVSVG